MSFVVIAGLVVLIVIATLLPLSRHTKTPPRPDKWRQDGAEIERVLPEIAAVSARLPS